MDTCTARIRPKVRTIRADDQCAAVLDQRPLPRPECSAGVSPGRRAKYRHPVGLTDRSSTRPRSRPTSRPGLYWYHPHIHGNTSTQVDGGASGSHHRGRQQSHHPGIERAGVDSAGTEQDGPGARSRRQHAVDLELSAGGISRGRTGAVYQRSSREPRNTGAS